MKTLRLLPAMLLVSVLTQGLPGSTASDLMAQAPMHNCSFCHNLHGGGYAALSDWAVTEDLCLSCHGDAGPATVDRDGVQVTVPKSGRNDAGNTFVAHNGAKHSAPTNCWDCHNHEGEASLNFKMIQSVMPTPASGDRSVVFTAWSGVNSFADGDATYDGVCEVCHTATDYHNNIGPPGTHNFTDDCTDCHLHGSGFEGAGGGCAGCHSSIQGSRRAVVGEFDRTSHHVDWAGGGLANSGEIPDSDCTTCHDQSAHQAGNVRLKDVDDPTNTAASVVLTGDPNTSSTEAAKLEAHCLSCHDADGANGNTTPFTGGATVVAIDNTAWLASSHEGTTAIAGCYGDGTIGCHSSGHGSQKTKLLGPPATAATAPAYAEQEEGFCFNCHDSDGPAGTDMDSVWGEPINWMTNASGVSSLTTFNDRHDVQQAAQATSGAVIECAHCHNPHGDNASQPYRLDPDPSDGHVVGTDWYFTEYQSEGDLLSEFCLDCHDGSLAAGTSGHSGGAMDNVRTSWITDGMGSGTGGPGLIAGTGWVAGDILRCWTCHLPHPRVDEDFGITNNFAMVDTVRTKDLSAYIMHTPKRGSPTYIYSMTDDTDGTGTQNGGAYCMTCHDRTGMISKGDCWSCHMHGDKW